MFSSSLSHNILLSGLYVKNNCKGSAGSWDFFFGNQQFFFRSQLVTMLLFSLALTLFWSALAIHSSPWAVKLLSLWTTGCFIHLSWMAFDILFWFSNNGINSCTNHPVQESDVHVHTCMSWIPNSCCEIPRMNGVPCMTGSHPGLS